MFWAETDLNSQVTTFASSQQAALCFHRSTLGQYSSIRKIASPYFDLS